MDGERPPRTLFLADRMGPPDGSTHGGTTYFVETLPELQRAGVPLTVCFMGRRHPAAAKLEERGVRPIFLHRSGWDARVALDVARIVREREIRVLHLASLRSLFVGRCVARLLGRGSVAHLHDTVPLPRLIGMLERGAARWTDAALVLTSAMIPYAERQWKMPRERLEVLPYGIDPRPFRTPAPDARIRLRSEWGVAADAPLIVLPGRIIPPKGQEELIRAAPDVLRRLPGAAMRIVGDGPHRRRCEALVRELGLEASVGFTGYRRDMPDVYAAADVVAVPSMWDEAFGFVALEAMAAGRPVVAYRDGGLPEVLGEVEGGEPAGVLVTRGDRAALAGALCGVLADRERAAKLGAAGAMRAEGFTLEKHVSRLIKVYTDVAHKSGCKPGRMANGRGARRAASRHESAARVANP